MRTPAQRRLDALRQKHGAEWRTKRAKTPKTYSNGHSTPREFVYLDQSRFEELDCTPVHEILSRAPRGYYINDWGETYIAAVVNLTHARFAAAYYSEDIEAATVDISKIYDDETDAAHAADSITQRAAEDAYSYYLEDAYSYQREQNREEYHRINRQLIKLIKDLKQNPPTETQLNAQRDYIKRELKTRQELLK